MKKKKMMTTCILHLSIILRFECDRQALETQIHMDPRADGDTAPDTEVPAVAQVVRYPTPIARIMKD
jgi:hypothetical protein